MKVTGIDIHRVTLPYDEARAYELLHYHDLTQRTIYVARTDSGLTGLGESEGIERQEVLDRYIGSNPFDWLGDETSLGLGTAMYDLMGKAAGVRRPRPHSFLARRTHAYMFNNQVWHRGAPNTSDRTRLMGGVTYKTLPPRSATSPPASSIRSTGRTNSISGPSQHHRAPSILSSSISKCEGRALPLRRIGRRCLCADSAAADSAVEPHQHLVPDTLVIPYGGQFYSAAWSWLWCAGSSRL